ncbi:TPA: dihydrodipicolinate synthase family protein, partial [Candidatus Geothermarchaeota archaeon]|nr:dihydrodipicolinate synthase family protein [Candidatus Geothermarchaeota archaeon]
MVRPEFYGVITPFITPFKEDLSIDIDAAKWLARYQAEGGVHGIFPNSTTGEFVHLKKEESIEITKAVFEEVGDRVWVIPGISANYTEHSIELGRAFKDIGVNGVIVTPPFFFKVGMDKLKLHFSK